MKRNIDTFINDLLHIDAISTNKLIDVSSENRSDKVYYLFSDDKERNSAEILKIISARVGKIGNTVLRGSALQNEQMIGSGNALDWNDRFGKRDPKALNAFIKDTNKELDLKGANPLFIGVGLIRWKVPSSLSVAAKVKEVKTPLLIFPIRLIRSVTTRPIIIEFVDDDIFVNPCLIAKLRQIFGESVLERFPLPPGVSASLNEPIDPSRVIDLIEYIDKIESYVNSLCTDEDSTFCLEKNSVVMSYYQHEDICAYYDIRKHEQQILENPLTKRLFTLSPNGDDIPKATPKSSILPLVLDYDSNQERIIKRILAGESLVIKGPPGTGKTLTIANTIAALMSEGKKVLLVSKKLAALSEVYKKLPSEMRDFLMLLDCETETQAANLSPSKTKADFASIIRICNSEQKLDQAFFDDLNHAQDVRSSAIRELSRYYEETFDKSKIEILGLSYYDALLQLMKSISYPVIEFTAPKTAYSMPREQFNNMKQAITIASEHLSRMCGKDGDYHSAFLCPYYTFASSVTDQELAYKKVNEISDLAKRTLDKINSISENVSDLSITHITDLIRSNPSSEQIVKIADFSANEAEKLKAIRLALESITSDPKAEYPTVPTTENDAEIIALLSQPDIDGELSYEKIVALNEASDVLKSLSPHNEGAILEHIQKINDIKLEIPIHEENMRSIFKSDLTAEELKKIDASIDSLAKYSESGISNPRFLDFTAKRIYSSLSALSYLSNPSFSEVVAGVKEREIINGLVDKIEGITQEIARLVKCKVTANDVDTLSTVISGSKRINRPISAYLSGIKITYAAISKIYSDNDIDKTIPLFKLKAAYVAKSDASVLNLAIESFRAKYEDKAPEEELSALSLADAYDYAKKIITVYDFISHPKMERKTASDIFELIINLCERGTPMLGTLNELTEAFRKFGKEVYKTYYSEYTDRVTFNNLKIFTAEAHDRSILSSASQYASTRNFESETSISAFLLPFESGKLKLGTVDPEALFEHSVIALAIKFVQPALYESNGRAEAVTSAIARFNESEQTLKKLNASLIRNVLKKRLNPQDSDFAFLNSEKDTINSLRRIFKLHASAIMKLKSCFLISPSSASVLFANDEFSKFDTVIIDEASQLEPVSVLPIIFRTKQCVFVGDEYQMPPISHFKAGASHSVKLGDSEEIILPPETSLLSLAIQSNNFDVEKLLCHFRSKTESLIAYSQKRFYPFMRTFPSPIPKSDRIGFKDIYVKDGNCSDGQNDREARAVIKELHLHFNRYFDEETSVLSESIGVIVFGEAQLELVTKYVESDKALYNKIQKAISAFDDIAEKLIFFKTVETVQGQETDHAIISLTYNKGNHFGDLSRKSVGECIFNVAVTRAKSSITLIHSLLPNETANESISDYLELSARFAEDTSTQFVSDQSQNNFVNAVRSYIANEVGINEKRLVSNFGVTDGSVRIPLAILSEDMKTAIGGIFCEYSTSANNYIDEHIRYYNILQDRGWKLTRLYAHDWIGNPENERTKLKKFISKL